MLAKLASHCPFRDGTPEQAKHRALDFIEDLAPYTVAEIEIGIRDYRQNPKNTWFPAPGKLLELLIANRKHKADLDRLGKPIKEQQNRPICWRMQPKTLWNPIWREHEVPLGEKIRDASGAPYRDPVRLG